MGFVAVVSSRRGSENSTNKSTLYDAAGSIVPLVVTVPGGPTGTIFNGTSDFVLGSKPAVFVFDAEDDLYRPETVGLPPP